jgi:hypothetical protein
VKWLVVIIFNTLAGDIFVFNEPAFDTRDECMITLIQSRDAILQKLILEYGEPMPIEAVNCVRQDVIEKVLKDEVVDISFTNEG